MAEHMIVGKKLADEDNTKLWNLWYISKHMNDSYRLVSFHIP